LVHLGAHEIFPNFEQQKEVKACTEVHKGLNSKATREEIFEKQHYEVFWRLFNQVCTISKPS